MSKNEREKLENQAGPIGNVHLASVPIPIAMRDSTESRIR
jgi:hypothetical protein